MLQLLIVSGMPVPYPPNCLNNNAVTSYWAYVLQYYRPCPRDQCSVEKLCKRGQTCCTLLATWDCSVKICVPSKFE